MICLGWPYYQGVTLKLLPLTARRYVLVGVTWRSIRQQSWYPAPAGPPNCPGARKVWRTFCRPGTNFIEHYACRGTSLIGATNLSPVTNLIGSTGAVSRHKVDRGQKTVKVYWTLLECRCACPGVTTIAKQSWVQEQKQKVWQTTYPYCPCYKAFYCFVFLISI